MAYLRRFPSDPPALPPEGVGKGSMVNEIRKAKLPALWNGIITRNGLKEHNLENKPARE